MTQSSFDPRPKLPHPISSIPSGVQPGTATVTAVAGTTKPLQVNVIPKSQTLALWDFLWSAYVDVDDVSYDWPSGSSLSGSQQNLLHISMHVDWGTSSDLTNVRVYYITIKNFDAVDHTLYMKVKAYTLASVAGA